MYELWGDLSGTAFSMSVPFSCGENKVNNVKNPVSEYAMDKTFETVSNFAFVEYSRVTGEELSDIQKEIIQGSYDLLGLTFDVGKAYAGYKAKEQKMSS